MIIFDLDGTLADCEHRRHFVVKPDQPECTCDPQSCGYDGQSCAVHDWVDWKPDWQAFYEACDKDVPIKSVINIYNQMRFPEYHEYEIQIWSGRCESVRDKTEEWLKENVLWFESEILKMRPIGNTEPDEVLKERWLDEAIAEGKKIDFVFDDRPKVVRTWRRRGIFVFNCCQHDGEF